MHEPDAGLAWVSRSVGAAHPGTGGCIAVVVGTAAGTASPASESCPAPAPSPAKSTSSLSDMKLEGAASTTQAVVLTRRLQIMSISTSGSAQSLRLEWLQ